MAFRHLGIHQHIARKLLHSPENASGSLFGPVYFFESYSRLIPQVPINSSEGQIEDKDSNEKNWS